MTLPTATVSNAYTGNGATTTYPYTFKVWDDDELEVYVDGTLQTKTTHYTVTGVGTDAGGNVVFVTAPGNGLAVFIAATSAFTQETDLVNQSAFRASSVEGGIDKVARAAQVGREQSLRSLRLPAHEARSELLTVLPELADRKGKTLAFDATTGQPTTMATSTAAVSAAMQPVVQAATTTLAGDLFDVTATGSTTARSLSDRVGEVINVKDFGAVGDDVTDDSAAIAAAVVKGLTDGGTVFIPPGLYSASVSVTVTYASRPCLIVGYGARITSLSITTGSSGQVRNLVIEGVDFNGAGSGGVLSLTANSSSQFIYAGSIRNCRAKGIVLTGNVFEFTLVNNEIDRGVSNTTDPCIDIGNGGGTGIISSIDIYGGSTRYGSYGLYVRSPVSDLRIYGGTYLFAGKNGIYIPNSIGTAIFGTHVESNNTLNGASDVGGIRMAGYGSVYNAYGYNSIGHQDYIVDVNFSANGQIIGGGNVGGHIKFARIQTGTDGSALVAGVSYDVVGSPNVSAISDGVFTGRSRLAENFFNYAASITPNYDAGNLVRVNSLTGNITINNPTNVPGTGSVLMVDLGQDGVGGRTVTWDTDFATSPTAIDATASKRSVWTFIYTNSKWRQTSFAASF